MAAWGWNLPIAAWGWSLPIAAWGWIAALKQSSLKSVKMSRLLHWILLMLAQREGTLSAVRRSHPMVGWGCSYPMVVWRWGYLK